MNRRIIIVDEIETPDYARYFGLGSNEVEVYTIQYLEQMRTNSPAQFFQTVGFGEGDGVMTVGAVPFKWLRELVHVGIRNETYYDVSFLYRLSMEGGAYLKEVLDFPSQEVLGQFLSPTFCKHINYPFKYKVLHTYQDALNCLNYFDSLPLDTDLGFDYEASGLPYETELYLCGVGIASEQFGGFISFTDIKHEVGEEEYHGFLKKLGDFVMRRMTHLWTYNLNYEYCISHRFLGIDPYDLADASVVNAIENFHTKKYSLKWTAQRVLGVQEWDSEFDWISDTLESMYFTIEGKLKRDKHKVFKVSEQDYQYSSEWKEICSRYPEYIEEFKSLIHEYWGYPFANIPSEILGKYCCKDSLYTLLIYKKIEPHYSKKCFQVFLDNLRYGSRLESNGMFIDQNLREQYDKFSIQQMAYGITYIAAARCYWKMKKHEALAANIKKYPQVSVQLLNENAFFNGDLISIIKYLLSSNIDTLDTGTETGLNEGGILMKYGEQFTEAFLGIVKDSMIETKFKGKIDSGVERKKKIISVIAEKSAPLFGLDKIKINNKHLELEKYIYYRKAYDEIMRISTGQLVDINNLPSKVYAFGETMTLEDYCERMKEYAPCTSPEQNDEIVYDLTKLYQAQTAYLGALYDSSHYLPGEEKFYTERGITEIGQGYSEFMEKWEAYHKTGKLDNLYPEKMFETAHTLYGSPHKEIKQTKNKTSELFKTCDAVKDVWSDFKGFYIWSTFFPSTALKPSEYNKPFAPEDMDDAFYFHSRFTLAYLLYKKYDKTLTTYLRGMLAKGDYMIMGGDGIPVRYAKEGEPGAVFVTRLPYFIMEKATKRSASPVHTIPAHTCDLKRLITVGPRIGQDGKVIYGGADEILTYYDISSCEMRTAAAHSNENVMIDLFNTGQDVYIYCAKLYYKNFDAMDKKKQKAARSAFKTVLLGILYGLGKNSLAARIHSTVEEAENIIQSIYTNFPKLREYILRQQQYPLQHNGYVNTILGDKLRPNTEWKAYVSAKSQGEKRQSEAKMNRLGINMPIQSSSSLLLASGFHNVYRESVKAGWKKPLRPIIVVHDSSTLQAPAESVFDILPFYQKHCTGYLQNIPPNIKLLFDLLLGTNYEDASPVKVLDEDTIEFSGLASQILSLYDKIMGSNPEAGIECNMTRDEIGSEIKYVDDPIERFILEGGTCLIKDIGFIQGCRFHRTKKIQY